MRFKWQGHLGVLISGKQTGLQNSLHGHGFEYRQFRTPLLSGKELIIQRIAQTRCGLYLLTGSYFNWISLRFSSTHVNADTLLMKPFAGLMINDVLMANGIGTLNLFAFGC